MMANIHIQTAVAIVINVARFPLLPANSKEKYKNRNWRIYQETVELNGISCAIHTTVL